MTWLQAVHALNFNADALRLEGCMAQPVILFYSYDNIWKLQRTNPFCELPEFDMTLDSVTGVAARHDRHSPASSGIYTSYGLPIMKQYYAAPGCL